MHSRTLFLLSFCSLVAPLLRAQTTPASAKAVQLDDYIVETNRATFDQKAPAVTVQVLAEDMRAFNLTTPEDALKNLPNIYSRRRFIGDKNAIVGIRGTSMRQTGRTVVYADGMMLSNFLATGFGNSPRWFLVAPEEIAKVALIYGPFSARSMRATPSAARFFSAPRCQPSARAWCARSMTSNSMAPTTRSTGAPPTSLSATALAGFPITSSITISITSVTPRFTRRSTTPPLPRLAPPGGFARRVVFEPSTIIMKTIAIALGTLCVLGLAACGKKTEPAAEKSSGHVHVAPHGGTLVEIGDHAYNLELVRDDVSGKLTAYVLNGHAENFVRIKSPTIELIAMPGGTYTPVSLKAVANPSTGETVGDTCQFEAQADWLKTAGYFSGIFTVEIRGTKFEQVAYHLPKEGPAPATSK